MSKCIKLIFNYLLAPFLFVILCWSLYQQLSTQQDLAERWSVIRESWKNESFWIVCILMFVNWGIEARKWQLLISPLEKFTLLKSFKSVLAGCSVTMLTPNRIGEYGGRILYVQEQNRIKAISVTILGSISQLLITMFMGTIGLIALRNFNVNPELMAGLPYLFNDILLFFSFLLTVLLLMFYLRISWILRLMLRVSFLKKLVNHINILDQFSGKQLLRIVSLSFSRYIVFILQYTLLLNVLEVNVSMIVCFWLLTIFYLIMAMAPTIGFIELPVRAAASVELFKIYSNNLIGIQAAAFGIWLINLVIPALIGSLLIFGLKIMKDR